MTGEEMRQLADEMVRVTLNEQNVEASGEYWKEDMIWHGPDGLGVLNGIEDFKHKLLYPFFRAFPDYVANNVLWAMDEPQQLVTAWGYFTGTHHDVWAGVEGTGREVRGTFMDLWRIEHGKLAENWVLVDVAGVMQQLGVLEIPDHLPDARVVS